MANGRTVIDDADPTGKLKGSATVFVDSDGKVRCITCGAVHRSPGALNGTAVAVDSAADAEPAATLDGTAVAVDSAASALPGMLTGITVNVNGNTVPVFILSDGTVVVVDSEGNAVPVIFDGTAFGASTDANGASTDGKGASTDGKGASTDGKGPSTDGKGPSTDDIGASGANGRSYGATAAKVLLISGGAVAGCVALPALGLGGLSLAGFTSAGSAAGSIAASWMSSITVGNGVGVATGSLYSLLQSTAMGGGWLLGTASTVGAAGGAATGGGLGSWVSSKLRRTTASSSGGCDPGSSSDVQEKSMERCVTCGKPVAAATSRD